MKKIFLLLASLIAISACGVKGDPLPPEKKPKKKIEAPLDEDEAKKAQ